MVSVMVAIQSINYFVLYIASYKNLFVMRLATFYSSMGF